MTYPTSCPQCSSSTITWAGCTDGSEGQRLWWVCASGHRWSVPDSNTDPKRGSK